MTDENMTDETQTNSQTTTSAGEEQFPSAAYGRYVTILMTIIYILSYVDRTILNLLVEPIKVDMDLTDTQMGLLLGAAFAIFYTTMGLPLGWLADRSSRTKRLGFGVLIWSAETAITGFARNFTHLFAARVIVGAGEATLGPCAVSLISDSMPPGRRARALSVYFSGLSFAAGLAYLIGGQVLKVAETLDMTQFTYLPDDMRPWQLVFLIVGLPGLFFALLVFLLKEPKRLERGMISTENGAVPMREVLKFFKSHWLILGGIFLLPTCMTIITYSHGFLAPMFERTWGWSPVKFSQYNGWLLLIIGPISTFIGGWMVDRYQNKNIRDGALRVMLVGFFIMVPTSIAFPLMPTPELSLVMIGISTIGMTWLTAASVPAMLTVIPAEIRGQGMAFYLMVINIFGLMFGPALVGIFTDQIFQDPAKLRYSMALLPFIFGGIAFVLLPTISRNYRNLLASRA